MEKPAGGLLVLTDPSAAGSDVPKFLESLLEEPELPINCDLPCNYPLHGEEVCRNE
jgi:hypothetical protein